MSLAALMESRYSDFRSFSHGYAASFDGRRLFERKANELSNRWVRLGIVVASALAGLALIGVYAFDRPIPLKFRLVALADGHIVRTPARIAEKQPGTEELLPNCLSAYGLPIFGAGDTLALRVASPPESFRLPLVSRQYYLMVLVPERADLKVFTFKENVDRNGADLDQQLALKLAIQEGPDQSNLLYVMARRFEPFEANQIERDLHAKLDSLEPSARIRSAGNLLSKMAPNSLIYVFRTSKDAQCSSRE
jgi:hypothetical protein